MIYTRWGDKIELVGYCGGFVPEGAEHGLTCAMAKVRYVDEDQTFGYQFLHNLKADGGIQEIDAVSDRLPVVTLTVEEAQKAVHEAS